ncbi:A24 family peptidase [Coralliovum pocilloporae]|uniref:A24 family peptidase n=1 Tax=Coralliovum pocilloporae TaxID=3066369 RepID=UPI003306DEA0
MTSFLATILLCVFPLLMIYAALSDLFTMTIPNRISLVLIGAFLAILPFSGLDLHTIGLHFAVAFGVLVVGMCCFAMGWAGGGDVKLAAATTLWLGLGSLAEYFLYTALLGGGVTLMLVLFRSQPLLPFLYRYDWMQRLHSKTTGIPYGVALGIAALIVYPETGWVRSALALTS